VRTRAFALLSWVSRGSTACHPKMNMFTYWPTSSLARNEP
jgi:hypothetical protein